MVAAGSQSLLRAAEVIESHQITKDHSSLTKFQTTEEEMGLMANTLRISPLPLLHRPSYFALFLPFSSAAPFKRIAQRPFRCCSTPNTGPDSEPSSRGSISTYNWCTALGSLGFLETGYLTYLKLTNSDAFCPLGGGSCSDVLNSAYAVVYGFPLPLIGMVAYGLIASLGLQLAGKSLPFGLSETNGRLALLGSTTAMATASSYFLYLLSTKLAGASCSYCLLSALLAFSLFFITLKDFGLQELQKEFGLLFCISAAVFFTLNTSYSAQPEKLQFADIDLEPFETEITNKSSPLALSLAKHLRSVGAKMYGAFWCSHCLEQKQMFGREAAEILDYVECFPDGAGKGRKMAKSCEVAGLEGFPTWVIKDKVLSGEQTLEDLAEASGFVLEDFHPA